ncbi:MAG: hypothetical protein ABIR05_04995 [Luteimonas sp.]
MTIIRSGALLLLLATLPLVGACNQQRATAEKDVAAATAPTSEPKTMIGKAVDKEISKARKELRTGNISIGGKDINVSINGKHYTGEPDDGRPRAEISPQGDLLVDGKIVASTPAQRAMLLEYRGQVINVAEAGMVIGAKAADLAGSAIKQSLAAVFSGKTDEIEKHVEAEAMKLKAEATIMCQQLPAMLATQQKLAASMPAFKPYANMTQDDIDDCAHDVNDKGAWSTQ